MELTLSKHFETRWLEYFGSGPPSPAGIIRIIRQSIILVKGRLLHDEAGYRYKLLSIYWHPERRMVIKIDWLSEPPTAVTVITEKSRKWR